jgi:hypothetical protein
MRGAHAWLAKNDTNDGGTNTAGIGRLIGRVDAKDCRLVIHVNLEALLDEGKSFELVSATFDVPFKKRQTGRAKPIVIVPKDASQPDPDLIALVADARRWARDLIDGNASTIRQIDEREGLRSGSVSRILPLVWLAPDIATAILEGRQPTHLTAKSLRDLPELPLDWKEQRRILGFAHR